ncbi:MAG: DNA-binding response regulator [Calditrichaeota bacterium]|nr:MAG: DNA-binding response regulator [Calditrichota bacterium]
MKFRTLLVDDEPLALQRLRRLLRPHAGVIEIVGEAGGGEEALRLIRELQPDLIFLDIQMPECNGFEVLERLDDPPLIIFSTAYDEFALKAFETNAIDYLVKPVDPRRLARAVEKLQRLTSEQRGLFQRQLQDLLRAVSQSGKKRLQVKIGDRILLLESGEIYFFRAADKYVEAHTFDQTYLLNQSLNELEKTLPSDDFVRIHRSALINLNHLAEIIRDYGQYKVRMRDKQRTVLPVSRGMKGNLGLSGAGS